MGVGSSAEQPARFRRKAARRWRWALGGKYIDVPMGQPWPHGFRMRAAGPGRVDVALDAGAFDPAKGRPDGISVDAAGADRVGFDFLARRAEPGLVGTVTGQDREQITYHQVAGYVCSTTNC